MWSSVLQYIYDYYYFTEEYISVLKSKRATLLQNLQVEGSNHAAVELVKQQGTPLWFKERRVRFTASLCKDIVSLKSDKGIMNFLNRYLWNSDFICTPAMLYGTKFEKKC